MADTPLLAVDKLRAGYGESRILNGISFEVPTGGAVCLLGRNGVGKTTLLKCIAGLIRPRSGYLLMDGREVTGQRPDQRARAGLGYVPQGRGIFPRLSVFENLLMGFEASPNMSPGDRSTTLDEMYQLFPVLHEMRQRLAGTLSGGQQQQLAIARALVARPRLLLLDEPTEGIQPSIVQQIEQVLVGLHLSGIGLLLVEQFVDFAVSICDHYHVIERGTVVASGETNGMQQGVIDEYLAV